MELSILLKLSLFFIGVGILCVILSGLSLNTFVDGNQQRANFNSETKEFRKERSSFGIKAGIFGLIFLAIGFGIQYVF
jgi:CHASE3 domain sensor protein